MTSLDMYPQAVIDSIIEEYDGQVTVSVRETDDCGYHDAGADPGDECHCAHCGGNA